MVWEPQRGCTDGFYDPLAGTAFDVQVLHQSLVFVVCMMQDMMQDTLRDLLNAGVVVYLDDILGYAAAMDELVVLCRKVFTLLRT